MSSVSHNVVNLGAKGSDKPWHVARGKRIKEEDDDTVCAGKWGCGWSSWKE